jgi:D-glycero-alpha-D-manno-heptose-7-phosphate kinase
MALQSISHRSPTRVDLAGGTLDCWPLYLFLNNPVTVNVAIDIFTYCDLRERADQKIVLSSRDLNLKIEYADLAACLADSEPSFELYRAHLRFWQPKSGFELDTRSESPIGGGLGGSSSLCISMLKVFSEWLKKPMEPKEMVLVASHLEAQVLLKPTGTQDYFPPIFGGINFIEYGVRGPEVKVVKLPKDLFQDRFLLVYTGRSHHSGINNWQVIKNYLDGDVRPKQALTKLAGISKRMRETIEKQNWSELPGLFSQEYDARTELSDGFSSPEIRKLQQLALSEKAVAKICGAGGGGCVLIWCPDRQADRVAKLCESQGFQVLPTQPWEA